MIFKQIVDIINIGLVILDADLKVQYWNRWMELQSRIAADEIVGSYLFDFFPELNTPRFLRNCKSVLKLRNFCFFSQKIHGYLFPFKPVNTFDSKFENMQQNCTMGPLRDEDDSVNHIFISVQDVTDIVAYERELEKLSIKDGLTGAYNRRFLEIQLHEEVEKYKRYSRSFSVIILDIDFFKRVNDNYGHQCGDFVLTTLSSIISQSLRKTDFLVRYGGEEFCCLLPETNLKSALILAERLRANIANQEMRYNDVSVRITISLGVAAADKKTDEFDMILRNADEALYRAKESGRNKVVAAS